MTVLPRFTDINQMSRILYGIMCKVCESFDFFSVLLNSVKQNEMKF